MGTHEVFALLLSRAFHCNAVILLQYTLLLRFTSLFRPVPFYMSRLCVGSSFLPKRLTRNARPGLLASPERQGARGDYTNALLASSTQYRGFIMGKNVACCSRRYEGNLSC